MIIVRITQTFQRLAIAASLGLAFGPAAIDMAMGQSDQPTQPKSFGPRVKPPQQAAPAAEVIATHGAWKVQCEVPPAGQEAQAGGQKQCGMVQGVKSEKNPKAGMTLVIVKAKQGDKIATMMRVMAPIGVFLPTGVALEIDGAAVGRVPFTRCMPQVCVAFAEATPDTLAKMKKGTAANFIIYEAPGLGLPMKISLEGFSAALGELDKL